MKQITLAAIELANFRSFATPTRIDLTPGPGLKLVTGSNEVEPRLGGNGVGKSTVWDAVCFVLFGTSVKGLRPSDLLTNGADMVTVTLDLNLAGAGTSQDGAHTIRRTAPPMRIYLDGAPAEQPDIDALIGLTRSRFLSSVVFGQAVPLFIDLPIPARGDLLDEVLDLELWMRASTAAGEQHRSVSGHLNELRRALARTLGQIEGLGDPARFTAQQEAWEQQRKAQMDELLDTFAQAEKEHNDLIAQRDGDALEPVDETAAEQRRTHFRTANTKARATAAALDAELDGLTQTLDFLQNNTFCPTCGQSIGPSHVSRYVAETRPKKLDLDARRDVVALDIQTTGDELLASDETWRGAVRTNQERLLARAAMTRQVTHKAADMARLEHAFTRWTEDTNPFTAEAERVQQELARLTGLRERQEQEETATVSRLASLDFWRQGFRKVRLFCLERVLQELTLETRNSLLALGLAGWRIAFATATETRSGTARLGVQVNIEAPEASRRFELLSGGESQRARLAVSLGLATLVQRWAGVRFNLEVWDEPTAFLSDRGIEDLLESLRERAEVNGRSIWVCDHRALAYAGFAEVMHIVKTGAGSQVMTA